MDGDGALEGESKAFRVIIVKRLKNRSRINKEAPPRFNFKETQTRRRPVEDAFTI